MKYRLLGNSGLRVSEICLGTMTFGTEWGTGADKADSRRQFDLFLDHGGNFIDTANRYTEGTSEEWLGEFIKESGRKDELVIATKYSLVTKFNKINDGGNHRKNLIQSVEGSLKRLKTDCIDLLYLHAWDFTTPIEEVMRGLDDLVRAGKIHYAGISDTPAWIVSQGQTIAQLRGWSPFIALQIEYSLITRDGERDLIPMANALGLGVTAWAPIAGGALTGKYLKSKEEQFRLRDGSKRLNPKSTAIAEEVVRIAEEIGCSPSHVALNWVRRNNKGPIPIIGSRKFEQLEDNLNSLDFELSDEQFNRLQDVSSFDIGFPHDFLQQEGVLKVQYGGLRDKIIF